MKTAFMSCEQALIVLAGETEEHDRDERVLARLHASRCPRCSNAYNAELDEALLARFTRPTVMPSLRFGLAVIAAIQFVVAVPWLFGHSVVPDAHVEVAHLTRDGALGLVIATLGLLTAWRPRYVNGALLMGLVVFVAQFIAGFVDHMSDKVTGSFELIHVVVVLILIAMSAVAVSSARRATPRNEPHSPVLRAR
jgi:hypothetical protein